MLILGQLYFEYIAALINTASERCGMCSKVIQSHEIADCPDDHELKCREVEWSTWRCIFKK